jgi:hypothetical protein
MGVAFKNEQRIDNLRRTMRFETNEPKPLGMLVVDKHNYEVLVQDHSLEGYLLIIDYNDIFQTKIADLYLENEKIMVRVCHQRLVDGLIYMGVEILSSTKSHLNYKRMLDANKSKDYSSTLAVFCMLIVILSGTGYFYHQEINYLLHVETPAVASASLTDLKQDEKNGVNQIPRSNSAAKKEGNQLESVADNISKNHNSNEILVNSIDDYKSAITNHTQNKVDEKEQSNCPLIAVVLDLRDVDSILKFINTVPRKDQLNSLIIKFVVNNDNQKSSYVDSYYKQLMVKLDTKHFLVSLDTLRNLKIAMRENQANWIKFVKTINQDLQSRRIRSQQDSKSGIVIYHLN